MTSTKFTPFAKDAPVNVLSNGHRYPGVIVEYDARDHTYIVQLRVTVQRVPGMWVVARKVRAS
jgi:hypothetical protein